MNQRKIPLIVIAGPTAVGKTELSIKLAKAIGGEIISGDSMQIYKGLNIGTAKISEKEMDSIPHHLIDIINPEEDYNVQIFQENAKAVIKEIHTKDKIPILVGGSGLYVDALVYDYSFINEKENDDVRNKLWEEYNLKGKDYILDRLMKVDPEALNMIDTSNIKRIIRALEVFEKNGIKFSDLEKDAREKKESPYELFYFVITMNREELYDRINKRVDLMFSNGWIEEVKVLLNNEKISHESKSMQGLGYKQIVQYLKEKISFEECLFSIKQETRRFAKRQLTWFRKNKDIIWFDKNQTDQDQIFLDMLKMIKNLK